MATEKIYVGDIDTKIQIRQEPKVLDDGIYMPVHEYVPKGCESAYRLVMSKEMFIEAYNKYIKNA